MREVYGNLWDFHGKGYSLVVPTNLGWRRDGSNVMGRGVASQAAHKFPDLPQIYGEVCQDMAARGVAEIWFYEGLIFFPTKPLDEKKPWLSWMGRSVAAVVEKSTMQLAAWSNPGERIALPLVGCGNGGLPEEVVLPILRYHLKADRFMLVRLP